VKTKRRWKDVFGIDFDFKDLDKWENFYRFYKAFFELSRICNVIVKETYKGYHIYCDADIPPEAALTLRYYFGDDPVRIMYDEERLKYAPDLVDTLYEEKMAFKVTKVKDRIRFEIIEHYKEQDVNVRL